MQTSNQAHTKFFILRLVFYSRKRDARARAWFQHPPTANPATRPPLDSPITCGEGGHLAAGRLCGTKQISNQIYLSKYIKGYLSNHPQYISIAIAKHSLQDTSGQLFSLWCTGLWLGADRRLHLVRDLRAEAVEATAAAVDARESAAAASSADAPASAACAEARPPPPQAGSAPHWVGAPPPAEPRPAPLPGSAPDLGPEQPPPPPGRAQAGRLRSGSRVCSGPGSGAGPPTRRAQAGPGSDLGQRGRSRIAALATHIFSRQVKMQRHGREGPCLRHEGPATRPYFSQ